MKIKNVYNNNGLVKIGFEKKYNILGMICNILTLHILQTVKLTGKNNLQKF